MCSHYAPASPDGCDEEGAEAVRDRQAANFCDWFVPDGNAFDGRERRADEAARARAQALFDQDASSANQAAGPDDALTAAEDLFRK